MAEAATRSAATTPGTHRWAAARENPHDAENDSLLNLESRSQVNRPTPVIPEAFFTSPLVRV